MEKQVGENGDKSEIGQPGSVMILTGEPRYES